MSVARTVVSTDGDCMMGNPRLSAGEDARGYSERHRVAAHCEERLPLFHD